MSSFEVKPPCKKPNGTAVDEYSRLAENDTSWKNIIDKQRNKDCCPDLHKIMISIFLLSDSTSYINDSHAIHPAYVMDWYN